MQRFTRIYMTIAVTLVTFYILLFLFGHLVGKRMVLPMPASSYAQAEVDWVQIPYSTGSTAPAAATDYVLAKVLSLPQPKGYILYQHGNYEDLGMLATRLQVLNDLGWSVLAWDYPGYGLSPGIANEHTVSASARAVAAYAQDTLGWPIEETVLYGRSIGGGPSILLASEAPYRGLITEGTFTSAFRVVTRVKLLPIDVFDNWSRIGAIHIPVLFLHGTRDFTVPFSHSQKLYASANEPKYNAWFKGGGHNNLFEDFADQYIEAVRSFLDNLPVPPIPTLPADATPQTPHLPQAAPAQ